MSFPTRLIRRIGGIQHIVHRGRFTALRGADEADAVGFLLQFPEDSLQFLDQFCHLSIAADKFRKRGCEQFQLFGRGIVQVKDALRPVVSRIQQRAGVECQHRRVPGESGDVGVTLQVVRRQGDLDPACPRSVSCPRPV